MTTSIVHIRSNYFPGQLVPVRDIEGLPSREREEALKEARKVADKWVDLRRSIGIEPSYERYVAKLQGSYDFIAENARRHYLHIRDIENRAIQAGEPRQQVEEKSNDYVRQVLEGEAPLVFGQDETDSA